MKIKLFNLLSSFLLALAPDRAALNASIVGNDEEKDFNGDSLAAVQSLAKAEKTGVNKLHILYLLQSKEYSKAIDLYYTYKEALGRHDFEILQQMGLTILEMGARSQDPETQLTSIFGSSMAGITASIDILEAGIASTQPHTQVAAIQFLGHLQEDRCEELLTKAMSSDYFFTRLEAAHQLAVRKARTAVGQIESLMYKVPPEMRFFFPPFFALIGTADAISILKQMMDDPFYLTRIEAIRNAALYGRDDLLPLIRSKATHLNVAEQEICAAAMGYLKDSRSLSRLKILASSSASNVKLAARRALYHLGDIESKEEMIALARQGDLFAITLLGEIPGSQDVVYALMHSKDLQVRFNATLALLQLKDPRVLHALIGFLVSDSRDLGFQPHYSVGNSLMAWKVIPSLTQHQKDSFNDLPTITFSVREHILRESLELPHEAFLKLAKSLFDAKQTDLIPLLISLIENLQTPLAVDLLEESRLTAGAPLIRAYCNLALLRIKKESLYETAVLQWIALKKHTQMIQFRPVLSRSTRVVANSTGYELTPEEHSRLLIECYQTMSLEHTGQSIDLILDSLKTGHPKNRSVLAGLLIQAIQ